MPNELQRIRVESNSELAHLLDAIGETPVVLEMGDRRYRLIKEEDSMAEYDPSAVTAAIRKTAGSWSDIDADKYIAELYRAREEGSRPMTRP